MYMDNNPWLIPKNTERTASSTYIIDENAAFMPNNRTDMARQPLKHVSIARRTPSAFESQPETKPPARPPAPKSIIDRPRSDCPSALTRLCTQVGIHENMPHNPISIEPNMIAPRNKFFRSS